MSELIGQGRPEITGIVELAPDEIGDWESGYQTGRIVNDRCHLGMGEDVHPTLVADVPPGVDTPSMQNIPPNTGLE